MGREASVKPQYEILSYVTTAKERILSGNCLCLYAETEEEAKKLTVDIAKAMKTDVVQLENGDYMCIRV